MKDRHVECVQALVKKTAVDDQTVAVVSPDTPNVIQSMMQVDQTKTHVKSANKVALEEEKEKDDEKEETHVRAGHHWLLKFGQVDGSMSEGVHIGSPEVRGVQGETFLQR